MSIKDRGVNSVPMVRNKAPPAQLSHTSEEMEKSNCKLCELALNRKGENRPGTRCKECKREHCFKCAELSIEFCETVKKMGKDVWSCSECEGKAAVMKTVLDKIDTLHTEMVVIKKGQEGQQVEQERVLDSIKIVETVVKRMEDIEKTQTDHGERLLVQEESTRKNKEKIEETESRTTAIEKRLEQISSDDHVNVKLTNAVIREMYNLDMIEKNVIIANLPESKEEEAPARKKEDEQRVSDVFKELHAEHVKPMNVIRVGFQGRYPRKVKVILNNTDESQTILGNAEKTTLPNDIWLARDRTWNQREEARLFREEKEKQEAQGTAGAVPKRGRPPGSGKGPSRAKNTGSVRGRGSDSASRKRHRSGEEEENKWRRTGETSRGAGREVEEEEEGGHVARRGEEVEEELNELNQVPAQSVRMVGQMMQRRLNFKKPPTGREPLSNAQASLLSGPPVARNIIFRRLYSRNRQHRRRWN